MILFKNNFKFSQYNYISEEEFEKDVVDNGKLFFGNKIIYIEAKKKIDSKTLGGSVPDGILFDLNDVDNPNFYLVEVELAKHDFFKHIFPQITKFFAFFRSSKNRTELVEKIFSVVKATPNLKKEFKKFLGEKEIYKFIKDTIDDSQNILLIVDGEKKELPEIIETYSDTWGKMVKLLVLRKFINKKDCIYTLEPEFETVEYALEESVAEIEIGDEYSEEFHLEGVSAEIKEAFKKIKEKLLKINHNLIFNPQKYYISIVHKKNIAYFRFSKKKFRLVIMLPEAEIKRKIHKHKIVSLSEGVQRFYKNPCAEVIVENINNLEEMIEVLIPLISNSANL